MAGESAHITQERIDALNQLGFNWTPRDEFGPLKTATTSTASIDTKPPARPAPADPGAAPQAGVEVTAAAAASASEDLAGAGRFSKRQKIEHV